MCNSLALTILLSSMIQLQGDGGAALDPRRRSLSERGAICNRKAAEAVNAFERRAPGRWGDQLNLCPLWCKNPAQTVPPRLFSCFNRACCLAGEDFQHPNAEKRDAKDAASPTEARSLPRRSRVPNGVKPSLEVLTH